MDLETWCLWLSEEKFMRPALEAYIVEPLCHGSDGLGASMPSQLISLGQFSVGSSWCFFICGALGEGPVDDPNYAWLAARTTRHGMTWVFPKLGEPRDRWFSYCASSSFLHDQLYQIMVDQRPPLVYPTFGKPRPTISSYDIMVIYG